MNIIRDAFVEIICSATRAPKHQAWAVTLTRNGEALACKNRTKRASHSMYDKHPIIETGRDLSASQKLEHEL